MVTVLAESSLALALALTPQAGSALIAPKGHIYIEGRLYREPPRPRELEHWRPVAPILIYSAAAWGDVVTTDICLHRGGVETDPLPGMQSEIGRLAWTVAAQGGLLALDRHLSTHHHSRWAHAERIAVVAWQAAVMCGNLGLLPGGRSWFRTVGLVH